MGKISWIKLATNMFEDEKIKLIQTLPDGNSIVLFWIKLLTLAGKTNDKGLIYLGNGISYNDEMLATITNLSTSVVRSGIKTLEEFGMIEITEENYIQIVNWTKHQNVEGMERVRDGNAERQRVYYYRKKLEKLGINARNKAFPDDSESLKAIYEKANNEPNVRLTLANAPEEDKEEDIEEDKDIDLDNTYIHTEEANYLIPISESEQYPITEDYFLELEAKYPDLDIHNEILLIGKWIKNNSDKNLTLEDMPKFINSWLRRASNFEIDNRNKSRK